jgi:undecaprenyl diphosphate synthase
MSPPTKKQERLPRHIAIIMDGNGRWAQSRRWMRVRGHEAGTRSVRETTEECARLGIEQLTLYAFSEENWRRPRSEIAFLMKLLRRFLVQERPTIMNNNIRLTAIGHLDKLPAPVRKALDETMEMSRNNTGTVLCLALSYGGRQEIVDAARKLVERARKNGFDSDEITEELFARHLYQQDMPEPDLLIRTAGEMRLSNFLLWQISYAELWVTPVLWPEFRKEDLHRAIADFQKRERRYGGLLG